MAKEQQQPQPADELLPTPAVGSMVLWYDRNIVQEDRAMPAMVMKIEAPGRVALKIFRMGDDMHRTGVHYRYHAIHMQRSNPATVYNGSWDYPREGVPTEDYEYHKKIVNERKRKLAEEEKSAAKAAAKQPVPTV